jgi:hypothetical protein
MRTFSIVTSKFVVMTTFLHPPTPFKGLTGVGIWLRSSRDSPPGRGEGWVTLFENIPRMFRKMRWGGSPRETIRPFPNIRGKRGSVNPPLTPPRRGIFARNFGRFCQIPTPMSLPPGAGSYPYLWNYLQIRGEAKRRHVQISQKCSPSPERMSRIF